MNYKNELKKKISADYERRVKQWMSSDPAQLVDAAETIAAARLIRDNLDDARKGHLLYVPFDLLST